MDLIPDEEIKPKGLMNLTPMVDFLFLVIAIFATLALTRTTLFDTEVSLATVQEEGLLSSPLSNTNHSVILGVTKEGAYKWLTEFNEYNMDGVAPILKELANQTELGLLPKQAEKTSILLQIDGEAEWEPIVQLIYSLKKTGYTVHPVYEKNSA